MQMPFVLFHEHFPSIAEQETRTLILPEKSGFILPPGDYSFLEMFCDEKDCDCRRVLLMVVCSHKDGVQAVINWGWEKKGFYAKWMKGGNPSLVKDRKGPSLNFGSPQSDLAPAILELLEALLLQDKAYRERIKRHYAIFRKNINDGKSVRKSGQVA
jgi:hypothetical protein